MIWVAVDLLGLNHIYKRINKNKIRVLMYHGVVEDNFKEKYWLHINKEKFEWQINYLNKHYKVHDPFSFLSTLAKNDSQEYLSLITFDDGLLNNYEVVFPLLRKYKIPAICFVVPYLSQNNKMIWSYELYEWFLNEHYEFLDLGKFNLGQIHIPTSDNKRIKIANEFNKKMKLMDIERRDKILSYIYQQYPVTNNKDSPSLLMSIEQIKTLSASNLFFIGTHTNTHPALSILSDEEKDDEISGAIKILIDHEIQHLPMFAYPSGIYDSATVNIINKLGIKAAFTTNDGLYSTIENNLEINRIAVGSNMNKYEFKARLSGLFYHIYDCIKKQKW